MVAVAPTADTIALTADSIAWRADLVWATTDTPTLSGWVPHGSDDYAAALLDLLPTGPAWPRDPDSVLVRYFRGLARIWGDLVDQRAAVLLTRESDPRSAIELLPDWERNWGLPDPCVAEPLSIGDRQAALISKMTMIGGQSRNFFRGIALSIGYETIQIIERAPFMFGISEFGDTRDPETGWPRWELGPPEIRFNWIVKAGTTRLTWWQFGKAQFGIDPHLRIALFTDLECLFRRYKPAHTLVFFDYT